MALLWNDTTITGTANDDYILGDAGTGPDHSLSGAGGRDLILGDAPDWTLIYGTAPGASAFDLTGAGVSWYQGENAFIANSEQTPHTTAYLSGTGSEVWYSFTTDAAQDVTIEVDILAGSSTTPIMEIWNADGTTLLAESESPTGVFESPAENTVSELGYLQWNTGGAGTFMVRIRDATSDVIPAGQDYLVHFALTGQTVNATAPAGADTIDGGDGDDRLYGGADDDSINGGLGNDDIFGGSGNDLAFGGTGKDTIVGDAGLDLLYGGDGDDFVMAGDAAFALLGDTSADTLFGGSGQDGLVSDGGGDVLYAGTGNDALVVAADDASPVTSFLYGGDGTDKATFVPLGSFRMDLRQVELSDVEEIGFDARFLLASAHMTAAQFDGIQRLNVYGNSIDLLGIDIDMGSEAALDLSGLQFRSLGPDDFANVFTIHGDDDAETVHGSRPDRRALRRRRCRSALRRERQRHARRGNWSRYVVRRHRRRHIPRKPGH